MVILYVKEVRMGILEAGGTVPREEGEMKGHTSCHLPIVCTMHTPPEPDHSVMSSSGGGEGCPSVFTHFSLQLNPEIHRFSEGLSVFVKC